jgi:hypothetical protein
MPMKRKQLLLTIVACSLLLIGIDSFAYNKFVKNDELTYQYDAANSCIWFNGKIGSTSLVAGLGPQPEIHIRKSDQATFLKIMAANNICIYHVDGKVQPI